MLDQAFKNVCTMVGQCSVNMTAEFLFVMYSIPVNSFDFVATHIQGRFYFPLV